MFLPVFGGEKNPGLNGHFVLYYDIISATVC